MSQRRARALALVTAAAVTLTLAGTQSVAGAGDRGSGPGSALTRPTKVVIIVVDALSKEIVEKYDMRNVEALMKDGVDTPNGYLGHTGSVTVVTHNVITTGALPKHMGWTTEGYRDVDGLLGPWAASTSPATSARPDDAAAAGGRLPAPVGLPRDPARSSRSAPRRTPPAGLSGPGSANTSMITFAQDVPDPAHDRRDHAPPRADRDGTCRRTSRPTAARAGCVARDTIYDTGQFPAQLYPATDDRYVVGHDPAHQGGDVWATDAVLEIMDEEEATGAASS